MGPPTQSLDYAPPKRTGRHRAVLALIMASLAVGVVGKLCWDKFYWPIRIHLRQLSLQHDPTIPAGTLIQRPLLPEQQNQPAGERTLEIKCEFLTLSTNTGDAFYYGPLGPDDSKRFVFLSLSRTDSTPVSSATLVVRTFTEATLFSPIRETTGAQILPFFTYRNGFRVDAPTRSSTNPSILVLTGTRDDVPFRFELLMAGNDRVNLVEDRSEARSRPATEPD